MKSSFITNRNGQKLAVLVEMSNPQKGLAFVMHGLGGFKEQPHIQTVADSFREKGFTVVRFDTTNTFGESEGSYERATLTNYYEDLEDVIKWAKTQPWYQEPFALSGHSLGGICTALYAENHAEEVLALAPISPVVSGALSLQAHKEEDPEELEQWQRTGWQETVSRSRPGILKRLPWTHMEDRLKYDLLPHASKLTMPTLLIVGEDDALTPAKYLAILYDALPPSTSSMEVIEDAPHTFRDPVHLKKIKMYLLEWIDSFMNSPTEAEFIAS